ncbi:MAG: hypothetical protein KA715_00045 [Xanthomonadaceae bacterium]|nr:hypothetical protein [Xanthomonadaceae bacterium]
MKTDLDLRQTMAAYLKRKLSKGETKLTADLLISNEQSFSFPDFLALADVEEKNLADFFSNSVSHYYEYLLEYSGIEEMDRRLNALREFWIDCQNRTIFPKSALMPADLKKSRDRKKLVRLEKKFLIEFTR